MLKWMMTALALLAWQLPVPVTANEVNQVSHTLSFPQKDNQYLRVVSRFPLTSETVEFLLPSWNPGSYLIRDFAGNLERFGATDSAGRSLKVTKLAKNHWEVEAAGASEVFLTYDVWAGRKSVSESWIESDFAVLNGAGVFLYNDQSRGAVQLVSLELPASWSGVHTTLEQQGGEAVYRAADYDELIDSPIAVGNMVEHQFSVNRHPYSLVLSYENEFWDDEVSAEDVARIVKAHQAFWGVNPFDRRYLFINLFMEKFGGLEHDHSTVMMCSAWQMRGRRDYIKWLGLVSHEFFHSWNIRRMRPEALVEYDYDEEVYTRELWFAEGLTSYYDNLLLFRGGLIDVGDYFELLAEEIRNYETTPGREVRSAELASFDTWIKQYKPDNNKFNSTVSYYRKGALIGFVADMEIRRASGGKASLDSVMRDMYARYGRDESGQRGYPPGAFEDMVASVAGPEVRKIVEAMLQTTLDPDVDRALDWYGLELNRSTGNSDNEPAPPGVGVKWQVSGSSVVAEHVLLGHSAAAAGVLPGDELLAINGFRVTPFDFQNRFLKLKPEEQVELTLVRHGRLINLPMQVGTAIPEKYTITARAGLNSREKKRMESWLGRDLKFLK